MCNSYEPLSPLEISVREEDPVSTHAKPSYALERSTIILIASGSPSGIKDIDMIVNKD